MTHPKISGNKGRQFDAHAAGLIALIIDKDERFLMLSAPDRDGKWEPVNGAYDGGETVLDGFLREIREEAGEDVRVRPISNVHTYNFRYDDVIPHMISITFLFEYLSGEVIPGDDMTGSAVKWMTLEEIISGTYPVIVPRSNEHWVYERAIKFYRLLKDEPPVELQPDYTNIKNKYGD